MERLLWIAFAGGLGTAARYLIGLWATQRLPGPLPWGTFLVNVVGAFLCAAILQAALTVSSFPPTLRLALTTGFLGGFTTWSSFAWETTLLAREGARGLALLYLGGTTVASLAAAALGVACAGLVTRG